MSFTYDSTKDRRNIAKHGMSLGDAINFDIQGALTRIDHRIDYGETRYESMNYLNNRLYILIWTVRDGNIRVISLRKANKRERKRYEEKKKHH